MTVGHDYASTLRHVTAVSDALDVTPDEVLSRCKSADVCLARQILYWLMRRDGLSSTHIGALLERDHTTVLYGVERVDADPELLRLAWSLVPREVAA